MRSVYVPSRTSRLYFSLPVSGQFPPEENSPPVRVGVSVKVKVNFRVGGQPDSFLGEKLTPG